MTELHIRKRMTGWENGAVAASMVVSASWRVMGHAFGQKILGFLDLRVF